jgi:hypothetical protein
MLRPRERRRPAMPNQLPQVVEERIVAFALGHPGLGPKRIAAMLARPEWGGLIVSPNGVYKALRRHGLSTRAKRLSLIAGYRAPYEPPRTTPPEPHITTTQPGGLVGIDCFYVGRLHGTKGAVWQLTAIDTYSSFAWAELVRCDGPGPDQAQTSRFAQRVARTLRHAGWRLERVLTDNGGEFQSDFRAAIEALGARQTKIRAAPPDQRPRRTPAPHDPRRMLAPRLRALSLPALPRPATRTRRLPQPLQPPPRPHRTHHPRPNARRTGLRCPQDGAEMSRNCRHNSESVQLRRRALRRPRRAGWRRRCAGARRR